MKQALLSLLCLTAPLAAAQHPWDAFPPDGSTVARPGLPGTLVVFGEQAEAVLSSGDAHPQAVAAVAQAGQGRLFAIAHNGYLSPQHFADDSFMCAALSWLQDGEAPGAVSFLRGDSPLAKRLEALGYRPQPYRRGQLDPHQLLIVAGEGPLDEEEVAELQTWLRGGGRVLAAICPWGWQQIHHGQGLQLQEDMAANQLLAPHGLRFTDGTAAAADGDGFRIDRAACAALNGQRLVAQLEARQQDAALPLPDLAPLEAALRALPADDALLLPRLMALLPPLDEAHAPTPEHPLKVAANPLLRLAVIAMDRRLQASSPEAPLRAPGADRFPGHEPTISARLRRQLVLDPDSAGWQSTGTYVCPGEVVELKAISGGFRGWRYRIGAHADRLWHKPAWPRWPDISRSGELAEDAESCALTSPFGGLLYFEATTSAEALTVDLQGGMAAPWWRQGESRLEDWELARRAPAPWGELQGRYLIITLPSASLRELEDPQALMTWWDQVVEAQYRFAGEELPHRPERFVADVLISAGYMHSGYPIMMHLDVAEPRQDGRPADLVDLEELQSKGNWGCFHELGHNRQQSSWTFGGTGEVTNNLFSLYCGEKLAGIEPWQNPWLEGQKAGGAAYLKEGADYRQWTRRPGVALLCFAQVQHAFGWEPFHQVFLAARAMAPAERPRDDAAKRRLWVRELSFACGHDLRAFFRKWGWPQDAVLQADAALDALPGWMPDFSALTAAASR